jgi:hypothetical protein
LCFWWAGKDFTSELSTTQDALIWQQLGVFCRLFYRCKTQHLPSAWCNTTPQYSPVYSKLENTKLEPTRCDFVEVFPVLSSLNACGDNNVAVGGTSMCNSPLTKNLQPWISLVRIGDCPQSRSECCTFVMWSWLSGCQSTLFPLCPVSSGLWEGHLGSHFVQLLPAFLLFLFPFSSILGGLAYAFAFKNCSQTEFS